MIIILDLKILSFELGPVRYSGEQFFAALRLVIHAEGGDGVDRGLAFVQGLLFFSFFCSCCVSFTADTCLHVLSFSLSYLSDYILWSMQMLIMFLTQLTQT